MPSNNSAIYSQGLYSNGCTEGLHAVEQLGRADAAAAIRVEQTERVLQLLHHLLRALEVLRKKKCGTASAPQNERWRKAAAGNKTSGGTTDASWGPSGHQSF